MPFTAESLVLSVVSVAAADDGPAPTRWLSSRLIFKVGRRDDDDEDAGSSSSRSIGTPSEMYRSRLVCERSQSVGFSGGGEERVE